MKSLKKISLIPFCLLFILLLFSQDVACTTTIGDSSFPCEEGDETIWEVTYASSSSFDDVGDKYRLTIDSITSGVHNSIDCLIIDATFEQMQDTAIIWIELFEGYYIAYNDTLDYLNVSDDFKLAMLICPIPLNLSMIGSTLNITNGAENYTISGNEITLIDVGGLVLRTMTYNSEGYVTRLEHEVDGELMAVLELQSDTDGEEEPGIPLGHYFMVIAFLTTIVVIIYDKKRIKK